jgi:hypothetical protein
MAGGLGLDCGSKAKGQLHGIITLLQRYARWLVGRYLLSSILVLIYAEVEVSISPLFYAVVKQTAGNLQGSRHRSSFLHNHTNHLKRIHSHPWLLRGMYLRLVEVGLVWIEWYVFVVDACDIDCWVEAVVMSGQQGGVIYISPACALH